MAALRQVIMQTRINRNTRQEGRPSAAQSMEAKAKGMANKVWENRTRER
jgi:hypothetical protein